jgi:hypothetical protein
VGHEVKRSNSQQHDANSLGDFRGKYSERDSRAYSGFFVATFVGGTVDNPLNGSVFDIESIANRPDYLGTVKELNVDTPYLLHPAFWKYAEASYRED